MDESAPMPIAGYVAFAVAGGLGMYFAIGGLFELAFYRRRDAAATWKLQPRRWPGPRARRREIALGTINVTLASIASGLFAHHVATGGDTGIYFDLEEHGLVFTIASTLLYFVVTDGVLYWAHRILHRRTLFRWIHRVHHRWTSPTAFTAMAMHPLEFAFYQSIMLVPLLFWPIHVVGLIAVLIYQNAIALLDHSGIAFRSRLPWQPPPRFHDDHHAHFHVNYGQTLGVWDRVFGTWRREGRTYGEDVYGGQGAGEGERLVSYR
jgi:Delta7-sterol 5-desaturase